MTTDSDFHRCLRSRDNGVELDLVIVPRGRTSKVVGFHDGRLKVAIAAEPVDGRANAELETFFHELFGVPKRNIEIVRGHSGKRKTVVIVGLTIDFVTFSLRRALGEAVAPS